MTRKTIVLMAVLALLASCMRWRVDIFLHPDFTMLKGQELRNVAPALVFFKGDYLDRRPDPTKLATWKQGFGTVELIEVRPIADALYEGMRALAVASKQGWSMAAEGDVKVNLTLMILQAGRYEQALDVGASSFIQIKADFLNAKTGELIYSNIYKGSDDRRQAVRGSPNMVADAIDSSIVRCVQSIGDDAELAEALAKIGS